ncbi:MAG: type I restriction enzyme HsdR N-terminal domain-containing protein [Bacteroidales bacterium]|jgi:hypothetical protein|nr:type I restriction enzyme HsdR N-terminal domain-containing protein [Bacteroidales bacterium]
MLIFDLVRKKYVALTPEEWVRQHLIHYLSAEKNCPLTLMSVETPLRYAQMHKRSDVVVYGRNGQPLLLAECKAPEVPVNQKVFEQIAVYHQTIQSPFLLVTNGLLHYCMSITAMRGAVFLTDVPDYGDMIKRCDGAKST